ncbi:MAG TPA: PA14 domain-containing protein [Oligoflexus sp.]|uniref:PA14 domain-containing protein n=1 Tax=Oligoflexus sp. TaxID=1971216 RepID=UPI002D491A47|nr:PA14 domain-containing protein [Oligoflexus sp.]HYX31954.1 PA14 domain-containing protein [Oligoflexus sp.]
MRKPLISLSLLIMALQACSGKPAGFQGDTASVSGATESGDAAGRNFGNRDAESDDATAAMPGSIDGNEELIETDSVAMDDSIIYEGVDATISVPAANTAASADNTASTENTGNTSSGSSGGSPTTPETSGSTGNTAATGGSPTLPASGGTTTPTTPTPAPLTLTITVPSTSLRAGSSPMQATAKVTGQTAAANVLWSVKSSGAQSAGTIDETGLYTAPAAGGGYDIIISAVLVDDPGVTASVTIKIVAAEQIFVGCQQGSEFFPITADVYQLPVNTTRLPDFSAIGSKLTTVCMDQYNVAARDWSTGFPGVSGLFEWFALRTTTTLVAATEGTYSFKLNSDDGAKLYIDGRLVIDNDGQHAPTAKEATVTLTAGEHTLSIDYFQGPRYQIALELYWKTPGASSYIYVPKASFK